MYFPTSSFVPLGTYWIIAERRSSETRPWLPAPSGERICVTSGKAESVVCASLTAARNAASLTVSVSDCSSTISSTSRTVSPLSSTVNPASWMILSAVRDSPTLASF